MTEITKDSRGNLAPKIDVYLFMFLSSCGGNLFSYFGLWLIEKKVMAGNDWFVGCWGNVIILNKYWKANKS